MEEKNLKKNQEQEETSTASVTVEVKVHKTHTHSTLKETDGKSEMIPVDRDEDEKVYSLDLSAEKVKKILKAISDGAGDFVKEKLSGQE